MALKRVLAAAFALALVGCGDGGDEGQVVQRAEAGGKRIVLGTTTGRLTNGQNAIILTFKDASGQPTVVQDPAVRFTMPAEPNMAEMNADAKLEPAGPPGSYHGTVNLGMKGPWQTVVSFKDATGAHRAAFTIQAE
ncbi:MAG: FixH family protein [Candidatus Sericytochromatia bacterium]